MSDKNTSTLQSAIDSVTGTVQSAYGSLIGSNSTQASGTQKQDKASLESDASHATLKGPGFTATTSGIAADDPRRQEGAWNQTIGAAKETVGGLFGAEGLKREGIEQNANGKGMEAQGQLSDLGKGVGDRVGGTVGGVVAGVVGDREMKREAEIRHDQGKTLQRGAEADIQKQNS